MSLYKVLPLIQAVISFALMLLIVTTYKRRPHKVTNYLFTLYLLSMTAWASFIFLMRSSSNVEQAYHWYIYAVIFCILTQVIIYHFSILYSGTNARKWVLSSIYLTTLCITAILLIKPRLLLGEMTFKNSEYYPDPNPLLSLFGLSLVFLTIFN
ncbi:MAG: hypothetical protein NTV30_10345, partial [Chloroflexi bacterium]|nr:hypothetical protein [Chloroflexota bacterium]